MPISDLLNDLVSLVKKDGTIFKEGVRASVQGNKVFITDATLPIEAGDHILRQLPSGLNEDHEVESANFLSGGSLSHWELRTRRSGQPSGSVQTIVNHITGNNARVNINSTDNSANSVTDNSERLFSELASALNNQIPPSADKERLLSIVDDMKNRRDGRTFKEKYQDLVESAANHMTVLAPFLPALTRLL